MPGRMTFSREEIDRARLVIGSQLEAYRELARAARGGGGGDVGPALAEFEHLFFNSMVLALDRPFVHRVATGKETTPLNELELIVDSLLSGDGVFRAGSRVRYSRGAAVVGLDEGEHVRLTAEQFERLFEAVFGELEEKFAE